MIRRGKPKKLGEKLAPVPFCPPQISHDVNWNLTWVAAVKSQHLTT
jgi:hypothetical protein